MADPATASAPPSPAGSRIHARIEWLLSPEHFQFKLLLGTAVGVIVILVLAVTCFVLTYRNQRRSIYRAQTITVMRLSSVVENDIAALENAHRGYLLILAPDSWENFKHRQALFQKHSEQLASALAEDSPQRKRILKMREIVLTWLTEQALQNSQQPRGENATAPPSQLSARLHAPRLEEARDILNSVQRVEQIGLNQRVRDQEWAV